MSDCFYFFCLTAAQKYHWKSLLIICFNMLPIFHSCFHSCILHWILIQSHIWCHKLTFDLNEMEGLWIVKAIQLKKKFLNIKPEVSAIEIGCHGWYIAILFLWPKRKNQLDAHLTYRSYSNLKSWVRKHCQTFLSLAIAIFIKMLDGVDSLIQ